MKKNQISLIALFSLLFVFPAALGLCFPRPINQTAHHSSKSESQLQNFTVTCLNTKTNTVSEVNLEEHLTGVLAAEMPASYELDALKAQAVAARSYILSKLGRTNPEHPEAVICTNPTHCKGWLSEEDAKAKWKTSEQNYNWNKLKSAVLSTEGEYMIYGDTVVEACFFSSGGTRTENSEDVWQASLPYLRSVENPEAAESTISQAIFTNEEFMNALAPHLDSTASDISPLPVITNISRTNGGSVATITICGKIFKGTEIRSIFGLKSANFTVNTDASTVTFEVIGNGHGVGMSQKGANQMAKNGKKYTEILSHYYTNIQIVKM